MRFDDRFLEELKGRLRLSDVIGKTVKLRRQGREFVGLSPFNKEKSPSFYVNDDKGFFHDFSSGKHGDLIAFLQETQRLSFVEAVEQLAGEAGMALPEPDPQAAQDEKKRQSLTDWLDLAAAWFEGELRRPGGREAREVLASRGLPDGEWGRFRLGYAPGGRTALKDYLVTKGARPAELVEAGLLIAPDDGAPPYDRFRGRIIFPITDHRGRTISFGGRAMDPQARAKYLNGPDTAVFDKGRVLYGLTEARRMLSVVPPGAGSLVAVEGYMDVIACQRADVPAVAAMGTALTEAQMDIMWRVHPEPTLCFDGDRAGRLAASRAIDRALPGLRAGRSFRFATVKGGKDPDDVLREQGRDALRTQLGDTTPFAEALFARERDAAPLDTPEGRAGLKQRLRAAAAQIQDGDLSQAYRQDLLARLDALFAREPLPPPRQWNGRPDTPPVTDAAKAAALALAKAMDPFAAGLAAYALSNPDAVDDHFEDLDAYGFGDPALAALAQDIVRYRLGMGHAEPGALRRALVESGWSGLLDVIGRTGAAMTRDQWERRYAAQMRLGGVERALMGYKGQMASRAAMDAQVALRAERDALRRAIKAGQV